MAVLGRGKIFLGIEELRCPRCRRINRVDIHSDLPEKDYLACGHCDYKALLNLVPIIDKYGIPPTASTPEKRDIGYFLQKETQKI